MKRRFSRTGAAGAVGCVLFISLFTLGYHGRLDFWSSLTIAAVSCAVLGLLSDPEYRARIRRSSASGILPDIAIGLGSAAVLYGVFAFGNGLSRAWFPWAGSNIEAVYALKQDVDTRRIVLLIALLIAPAEELFWRGFLQHRLAGRIGLVPGMATAALLYTAVHLPAGNIMLTIAALVGGGFWGMLYAWRRSLTANITSHIAWDLAVFVLWPLGGIQ